jgi:hypothetical protein
MLSLVMSWLAWRALAALITAAAAITGLKPKGEPDTLRKLTHDRFKHQKEDGMAVTFQRNIGMLLLAVWLISYGLAGMIPLVLPAPLMAVLALLAGILILVGR